MNEVLRMIKDRQGFKTQDEVIKATGMARSFFFDIKKGKNNLSDEYAKKIAKLSELPIDYVLTLNNLEKCKDVESKEAYKYILNVLYHLHFKE